VRLNRTLGSVVIFALAVGPLGSATADAQSTSGPTTGSSNSVTATPAPVATTAAITTSTIVGTATDGAGRPLGGAAIGIDGPVHQTATADDNGRYTFSGIPAGVYTLTATRSGYQNASTSDVTLLAGTSTTLDVQLIGESLSSIRTIATTRTSGQRSAFNTSGLAVTTLGGATIQTRNLPNLTQEVEELPGVTVSRDAGGRSPNTNFVVRGSSIETKVTIDGHSLSSGVFGTYNTNYANSLIFDQVEVLKGAGLNGVNAGESAVGTVNLRTRDFSANDSAQLKVGTDSFGAQFYNALADVNLLKDNKLSLLAVVVNQGYTGPDFGYQADALNQFNGFNTNPLGGISSLVQWQGDFSNTYDTKAELLKARYRFSQSTSLTGEFLGLQGLYEPQGGSYGLNVGNYTVSQCGTIAKGAVTFVPAGGTGCDATSVYNSPSAFNQIGSNEQQFSYFPNSQIRNNEPQFSAELRTTYKNDTFLLRPYAAIINRFIDGSNENLQPGYAGSGGTLGLNNVTTGRSPASGWYQVTDARNCTAQFSYNTQLAAGTTGSTGPCFTTQNVSTAYIGAATSPFPVKYATTTAAPACSAANPCYTTPTNVQRNGFIGFNTPFSQPEEDRLRGTTFSYLHPVKDNLYSLNVDYNSDDTLRFSNDTSGLPAGCNPVVRSQPNTPTVTVSLPGPTPSSKPVMVTKPNAYYQPACQINGTVLPFLPGNEVQIPPTKNIRFDYSATALVQPRTDLQIGLGLYYSQQRIFYQLTDPNAAAAAATFGLTGAEPAASTLIPGFKANNHFDPHVQLEYRPFSNLSVRANGGSSITFPYNNLVSGFQSLTPNGGPLGTTDTLNTKNPNLSPETTVAYDLGVDYRIADGSVFSVDAYDNTIHNVFVNSITVQGPLPGRPPQNQTFVSNTINGPLERSYGLDFSLSRTPVSGLGYSLAGSFDRAYYDQFGLPFYQAVGGSSAIVNGKQLDGTTGFTAQIPYFKANGQISYAAPSQKYAFLLGDAFFGNNNATGGPAYFDAYANYSTDLGTPRLRFNVTAQNLFNYNTGTFLGSNLAGAGFNPTGVSFIPGTLPGASNGSLLGVNAFGANGADGIVTLPPRTVYLSITGKY